MAQNVFCMVNNKTPSDRLMIRSITYFKSHICQQNKQQQEDISRHYGAYGSFSSLQELFTSVFLFTVNRVLSDLIFALYIPVNSSAKKAFFLSFFLMKTLLIQPLIIKLLIIKCFFLLSHYPIICGQI